MATDNVQGDVADRDEARQCAKQRCHVVHVFPLNSVLCNERSYVPGGITTYWPIQLTTCCQCFCLSDASVRSSQKLTVLIIQFSIVVGSKYPKKMLFHFVIKFTGCCRLDSIVDAAWQLQRHLDVLTGRRPGLKIEARSMRAVVQFRSELLNISGTFLESVQRFLKKQFANMRPLNIEVRLCQ